MLKLLGINTYNVVETLSSTQTRRAHANDENVNVAVMDRSQLYSPYDWSSTLGGGESLRASVANRTYISAIVNDLEEKERTTGGACSRDG